MGQEISQLFTSKLDDQLCQNLLSGLKGFEKKNNDKKTANLLHRLFQSAAAF